jgi:cell division protein FtsW (lipid II flippase)
MYIAVLFIHSWLRWVVLALGLAVLVASIGGLRLGGAWDPKHERLHKIFLGALDTQLLLGLLLYFFLSPLAAAARANMAIAMKDAQLRFFGVEHLVTMLIAVAVAHIGRVRSKRREGRQRYRTVLIMQVVWLVLTLLAIPWPGLDTARPLFRF